MGTDWERAEAPRTPNGACRTGSLGCLGAHPGRRTAAGRRLCRGQSPPFPPVSHEAPESGADKTNRLLEIGQFIESITSLNRGWRVTIRKLAKRLNARAVTSAQRK